MFSESWAQQPSDFKDETQSNMSSSINKAGEDDGCTVVYNIPFRRRNSSSSSSSNQQLRIECLSFDRRSEINSKWTHFNLSRHLQASMAANLVGEFRGAAKYCQDESDLSQALKVVRLQLIIRTDELEEESMPDTTDKGATHVTTRVSYGVQAFCVFTRLLKEGELLEDVEEEMEEALNHMVHSLIDRRELKCSNFNGKGRFYGDLLLDPRDCSMAEAYDLFRKLIETVEGNPKEAVPVTLWLRPLGKATALEEMDEEVLDECLQVLDGLSRNKSAVNTILKEDGQMKLFPHIRLSLRQFIECLTRYAALFRKELKIFVPAIRSGGIKEQHSIVKLLAIVNEGIFHPEKFGLWLEEKKKEIRFLRIIAGLTGRDRVPLIQVQSELNAALFDVNYQWTVVLLLPKLGGRSDQLLESMKNYTENNLRIVPIRPTLDPSNEEMPWYGAKNLPHELRKLVGQMLEQYEINQENGQPAVSVSFFMTTLIANDKSGPTSTYTPKLALYREGKLVNANFQLPSAPTNIRLLAKPICLVLEWNCETSADVIGYLIEYKLTGNSDSSWTRHRTTSPVTFIELKTLKDPSGYEFRVASVSVVGRSHFSALVPADSSIEQENVEDGGQVRNETKTVEIPVQVDQVGVRMEKFQNLFN